MQNVFLLPISNCYCPKKDTYLFTISVPDVWFAKIWYANKLRFQLALSDQFIFAELIIIYWHFKNQYNLWFTICVFRLYCNFCSFVLKLRRNKLRVWWLSVLKVLFERVLWLIIVNVSRQWLATSIRIYFPKEASWKKLRFLKFVSKSSRFGIGYCGNNSWQADINQNSVYIYGK